MKMEEPKVSFVALDMNQIVTGASPCGDAEKKSSLSTCDCSDGEQGDLPGCVGSIV